MSPPSDSPHAEHLWAAANLPWLVNGSLNPADAQRLRRHLEDCPDCRRDLEIEQSLARALSATPVVDYAPQASLARLRSRLDAAPERSAPRRRHARSPFVLVFAAQAAAVVVLSLTVAWLVLRPASSPVPAQYQTLSRAAGPQLAQLQVRFADAATAAEIRASLDRVGGHIVDGPSRAGVFLVGLDAPTASEQAAQALAADPGVRYVAQVPAAAGAP